MKHSKEKIQLVEELHRPARINFPRRRTIIKGLDDLWQMDLGQLDRYAKVNKNFKYILTVIDCFSKFIWAKPLKTKTGEEVTHVFESILKESGRRPKNLQTDQGREFFNTHFKKLMQKYDINHYNTYSRMKAAIVERAIRTIKERLFKYFSLNGSYKWIDALSEIIKNYNKRKHRTIKMRPCDVNKRNEAKIRKLAYNHLKIVGIRKFKVNDIVRISRAKQVFDKGYTPNWTTELFKISKVRITNPTTYLLEDMNGLPIAGGFYGYELQKTNNPDIYLVERITGRRKLKGKVQLKVRWLGLKEETWIDAKNIV